MNKVKGITVGTYLTKTVKNSKDKVLSSNIDKYQNLKMEKLLITM